MAEEEIIVYKSMNNVELYDSLYRYMRNEIFDNTIIEELGHREARGEIDQPIKSDLIYEFDNKGDCLGIKSCINKLFQKN
ncbi:MAG TPA: hypothetical protein VJ697_14735 [Nitrososphaeraceae archaeon]|nr:hypothetical protein [Nitrososphaeraceae archaeon]